MKPEWGRLAVALGGMLLIGLGAGTTARGAAKPITVWREVEDIAPSWGLSAYRPKEQRTNPHWFSGRGGAVHKEPGAFAWRFVIRSEVDPGTLLPVERTYRVFLRLYGYRQNPPISVSFDGKRIADFRTRKTEKTDAQGKYLGAGTFYWERAGTFKAAGGSHAITVELKTGPAWLDAILVTTDATYRPKQMEAKARADKAFFTDLRSHEIHPRFRHNGVSTQVVSPMPFRVHPLGGRAFFVKPDQSAVCHLVVPEPVQVVGVSSHFAGVRWKSAHAHKHIGLRTLGRRTLEGRPATHHAVDISYMGLDLYVFVKARAEGSTAGQVLEGRYWMEFDGDKQAPASLKLHLVDVPAAKPFEHIFIGPCGGNATSVYADYPEFARASRYAGMNICNPWWLDVRHQRHKGVIAPFLADCRKNGVMVIDEHSPFYGTFGPHPKREADDQAVTLEGKRTHRPSLIVSQGLLGRNLDRIRDIGAMGTQGVVLDDEDYNQKCDTLDYNPRCKEAFRKYLAAHTRLAYEDPAAIVRAKSKKPDLYKAWVTFKCRCVLDRYAAYRKAFDQGVRQAKAGHARTFFIAQILKNKTPEESRVNTYWDYRLLADYCTHISPMIYTYGGVRHAGTVGDVVAMYARCVGRDIIAPTLLAGHGEFGEVRLRDKPMIKYEIMEALMHKAPGILFWEASGVMNALNLAQISEAVRLTQPFEELFLKGERFAHTRATPDWVRVRALHQGDRMLVYVANYAQAPETRATVRIEKGQVSQAVDVAAGRTVPVVQNGFSTDFRTDRGKLFLLTVR